MSGTPTIATVGLAAALLLPGASTAQSLAPCLDERFGDRAECGTLTVLEDPSTPEGRKIDLNVVVLRAVAPGTREPVFLLAGGPGQGATDLAELALGPLAAVNETRDFVLVDQRGTGASNPLNCPNGSDEDPRQAFGGLFKPALMADCIERLSTAADLGRYNTPAVVADLEQVRQWLGYERVLLWGGSGGTRTALVWMRRHPDRVGAAVLDGVTPTMFRSPSSMARSAHVALERVFEDCLAQESCRAAYPDLESDFRKLLWLFEGGPVSTRISREDGTNVPVEMTRGDLAYALRAMLYSSRRITGLPRLIHDMATSGDVSPLAQALWRRDVALRPVVAMGVHFAVYCTEDMPFIDSRKVAELTDGTFLGTYLMDQYGAICDIWPADPVSRDYLEPTKVDIPILILSGYYDPTTPAALGDEVDRHLTRSRHVVVRDQAHGSGFACARPALIRFLQTGSLEELGPICEDTGAIEFEVP